MVVTGDGELGFDSGEEPEKRLPHPRKIIAIVGLQRGIPSKRESSARVDYVPALCTHHPSLLPIEWSGEVFGSWRRGRFAARDVARSPLNLII
ncbi:hypothetical protein V6N13_030528 [Hibiscus sabdariffa]